MAEEKQLFTPVEGEKTEEPKEKPAIDMEGLLKELEKVNLTDPNKLRGKLQNAEGYKTVQAEKDRLLNEVQSLRGEIEKIKSHPKVDMDDFGDIRNNAIDLEATIAKVIRSERQKEQQEIFHRQQAQMAAYQKITGHQYWKQVGPIFEERMRDPEINMRVQTGQLDPVELYQNTVVEYLTDLSKKSLEALQSVSGAARVKPPHVENSARVPGREEDTRDDRQKKIDNLREKAKKPLGLHQDDQMDLIGATLGDFIKR